MTERQRTLVTGSGSEKSDDDLGHLRHDDVVVKRRRERRSERRRATSLTSTDTEFGQFVSGQNPHDETEQPDHRLKRRRHSQTDRGNRTHSGRSRSNRRRKMRHIDVIETDDIIQDDVIKTKLKSSRRQSSQIELEIDQVTMADELGEVQIKNSRRKHGRRRSKQQERRKSKDLETPLEQYDFDETFKDGKVRLPEADELTYDAESSSVATRRKSNRRISKPNSADDGDSGFASGWIQLKSQSDGSVVTARGRRRSRLDANDIDDDVTYTLPSASCKNSQTRVEMHMTDENGRHSSVANVNSTKLDDVSDQTHETNQPRPQIRTCTSSSGVPIEGPNITIPGHMSTSTKSDVYSLHEIPTHSRTSFSIDIPEFSDIPEENSNSGSNHEETSMTKIQTIEPFGRRPDSVVKWVANQPSFVESNPSLLGTDQNTHSSVGFEHPLHDSESLSPAALTPVLEIETKIFGGDSVDVPRGNVHPVDDSAGKVLSNVSHKLCKSSTHSRTIQILDLEGSPKSFDGNHGKNNLSGNEIINHRPQQKNINKYPTFSNESANSVTHASHEINEDSHTQSSNVNTVSNFSEYSKLKLPRTPNNTGDNPNETIDVFLPQCTMIHTSQSALRRNKQPLLSLFRCKTVIPALPSQNENLNLKTRPKSWQPNCLATNILSKRLCVDMSKVLRVSIGDCFSNSEESNIEFCPSENVAETARPQAEQDYYNKCQNGKTTFTSQGVDNASYMNTPEIAVPCKSRLDGAEYKVGPNQHNLVPMYNSTISRDALAIDGASRDDTNQVSEPYRTDTICDHFNQSCPNCWSFDTSVPWYMWSGKGLGWKVLLSPLLLLVGPLVWVASLLNLPTRLKSCWANCWQCDHNQYWFSCKGKGAGWVCLLVPLYVFLGPLIIIFTVLTVILLACCGEQKSSTAAKNTQRRRGSTAAQALRANFSERSNHGGRFPGRGHRSSSVACGNDQF